MSARLSIEEVIGGQVRDTLTTCDTEGPGQTSPSFWEASSFLRRKASKGKLAELASEHSLSPPTGWLAPLTKVEFSARLFDIESTRSRDEMGQLIAATVGVDYEWVDEVIRDPPTD